MLTMIDLNKQLKFGNSTIVKNIVNFFVYIDFYGGTHLNFAMTTFQVVFVDHFDN